MSVIDNLITDRTSSDVSRWSELKSKGWSGMTESEKAEWSAGMKGAYKYTDLNRVNEAMVYLQNRLRGYGYLVDVVLPVIEDVEPGSWVDFEQPTLTSDGILGTSDFAVQSNRVTVGYEAWKAFGSDISQVYSSDVNPSTQTVTYTIFSSTKIRVTGISFQNVPTPLSSSSPASFTVEAGNDNAAWTPIGSFTNTNNENSGEWSIRLSNTSEYHYYRLSITEANTTSAYVNIGKIELTAQKREQSSVITTRPYWAEGDIPTLSQMEQYLQNVSNIRAVLEVLDTTPPVPSDMVGLTFEEANDIERILVDVETVINWVVAGFFRSNAFTVICGNRPLPSAQSDLGRTWDDIDAEALTWDDLDDHGSSWYVIQYGVLKGTAVGIL